MKFTLGPRHRTLSIAMFWVLGVAAIYRLTPEGPREGWQPPRNEFAIGFIQDGRTLVTIPRSKSGNRTHGTQERGPIRLWDIDTGRLRASHFGRADVFDRVMVDQPLNMLCVQQRASDALDSDLFYVRLHDAITGAEVARFDCHVPNDDVGWVFADDGRTIAFVTYNGNRPTAVLHDVRSGRRLRVLPDCDGPICFSPDGRRLAACRNEEIVVFDVPTWQEVARLSWTGFSTCPKKFSSDGKLLLDEMGNVWDVDAGVRRFWVQINSGAIPFCEEGRAWLRLNSTLFTADGRTLVVEDKSSMDCWLTYYDTATGEKVHGRQVDLASGDYAMHLEYAVPDRSLLLAQGMLRVQRPTVVERSLAKLPYLTSLPGFQALGRNRAMDAFVLLETESGREVMRGGSNVWSCTPDGRYILTRSRDEVYELWDVPARKPLRSILGGVAVWTLTLGLFVGLVVCLRHVFRHSHLQGAA
jgi:WD40 repeat protein